MTDEQRVREVLRGAVDDVVVSSDGWPDVERRAAAGSPAGGRRPFLPILAAAAAVLVAVGLAVVLTRGDENGTRVVTPAESTTTTSSTSTPPTTQTTAPVSTMPATFVATRDDSSELVLVSSATGSVVRTLVDLGPTPPGTEESHGSNVIESMALSPDGQYVFYSTGPEPIVGEMHRVSVATGKVDDLGPGAHPALSPDGRSLARVVGADITFSTRDGDNPRTYQTTGVDGVLDLEWTPGSDGVVAHVLKGDKAEWVLIDASLIEQPQRLDDSGGVLAKSSEAELRGGMLGFLGPDGVALFTTNNGLEFRHTVKVAQPVTRMRFDRSGDHTLFTGPNGKLYRMTWTEGNEQGAPAELVEIASDISLADW